MHAKSLLIAALAAAAAADLLHEAVAKRDLIELQARQTQSIDTACLTAVLSIYSSVPTEPPAIKSFQMTAAQTDPCSFSTPASLSAEYSSYNSEVLSWYKAHSSELYAALSKCPILTQYPSGGPSICTADVGGPGPASNTAGMTTVVPTGTQSTAAASGSSVSKAAAPKETGMVAAAIAVVGVIGAVAAL